MRPMRRAICAIGFLLFAGCGGDDTGLLDLTLAADLQSLPPQSASVELIGSGGIRRVWTGVFPPAGASALRLEYPNLPARNITFTVRTFDGRGCVLGESASFEVTIKAGEKVVATIAVRRSAKECGDGGTSGPVLDGSGGDATGDGRSESSGLDTGADLGHAGSNAIDMGTSTEDAVIDNTAAVDTTTVTQPDLPAADASSFETARGDSAQAVEVFASEQDAPLPAGPVIVSFTATPATISVGASTTLTAVFKNANGSSIDHGIGNVSSGSGVSTEPLTTTTTYRLIITDSAGMTSTQSVTVSVVARPSITSFTAGSLALAAGTLTQLKAEFDDGAGTIDHSLGAVTSGGAIATGVLWASTTFTLTVTNAAGDSVTKTLTIPVATAVGPGQFAPISGMTVSRSNHTATLLSNGTVLIAGGNSSDTRAEIYYGGFSATGNMRVARSGHTAVLLPNDKVLIVGGSGDRSAELYDPATRTFVPTGDAVHAREAHTATLLSDGRVLVVGGIGASIDEPAYLSAAEIYDPATGTFTTTGPMAWPRQFATANLLGDGRVLVAGGAYQWNTSASSYLASAEIYNSAKGTFSETGALATGRAGQTAVTLLDGRVLLVGGPGVQASELYDPSKEIFVMSGTLGADRYCHTTTLLPNGRVLVTGAYNASSSVEIYDPGTGAFAAGTPMTAARQRHTATLLPSGRVLIAGGMEDSTNPTSSAELYW